MIIKLYYIYIIYKIILKIYEITLYINNNSRNYFYLKIDKFVSSFCICELC